MCSCLETTATLSRTCAPNRSTRNYDRLTTNRTNYELSGTSRGSRHVEDPAIDNERQVSAANLLKLSLEPYIKQFYCS